MKDTLLRPGQVSTLSTNIKAIEETLRHPIPGGLLNVDEITDHLLTTGEVLTICNNIRQVEQSSGMNRRSIRSVGSYKTLETILCSTLLVAGGLAVLYDISTPLFLTVLAAICSISLIILIKKFKK